MDSENTIEVHTNKLYKATCIFAVELPLSLKEWEMEDHQEGKQHLQDLMKLADSLKGLVEKKGLYTDSPILKRGPKSKKSQMAIVGALTIKDMLFKTMRSILLEIIDLGRTLKYPPSRSLEDISSEDDIINVIRSLHTHVLRNTILKDTDKDSGFNLSHSKKLYWEVIVLQMLILIRAALSAILKTYGKYHPASPPEQPKDPKKGSRDLSPDEIFLDSHKQFIDYIIRFFPSRSTTISDLFKGVPDFTMNKSHYDELNQKIAEGKKPVGFLIKRPSVKDFKKEDFSNEKVFERLGNPNMDRSYEWACTVDQIKSPSKPRNIAQ